MTDVPVPSRLKSNDPAAAEKPAPSVTALENNTVPVVALLMEMLDPSILPLNVAPAASCKVKTLTLVIGPVTDTAPGVTLPDLPSRPRLKPSASIPPELGREIPSPDKEILSTSRIEPSIVSANPATRLSPSVMSLFVPAVAVRVTIPARLFCVRKSMDCADTVRLLTSSPEPPPSLKPFNVPKVIEPLVAVTERLLAISPLVANRPTLPPVTVILPPELVITALDTPISTASLMTMCPTSEMEPVSTVVEPEPLIFRPILSGRLVDVPVPVSAPSINTFPPPPLAVISIRPIKLRLPTVIEPVAPARPTDTKYCDVLPEELMFENALCERRKPDVTLSEILSPIKIGLSEVTAAIETLPSFVVVSYSEVIVPLIVMLSARRFKSLLPAMILALF